MSNLDFSSILQHFLQSNKLTQTAFAAKIGVKQSQVSEWLKGKAKPGYDSLRQMVIAFNLSPNYLLGLEDEF